MWSNHHRISLPLYLLISLAMAISIFCVCAHPVPDVDGNPASVRVVKRDLQSQEDDEENVTRAVLPMVISKRSATALGKLMHLLRTSMDHPGGRLVGSSREKESFPTHMHSANYEMFNGVQRRNQKSNYLRCYFNAVSCF